MIFSDDRDRESFLERLSKLLTETQTPCYAWALMSNHAHLLLRTGKVAIAAIMRRLLTGYAVSFNRRHRRHGHLFQNRYKSILCEEDPYLRQLVAYIHLNPLRAGVVKDVSALKKYPYTGHSVLMGRAVRSWQDTDHVLGVFGRSVIEARGNLQRHVLKWSKKGRCSELTGGGLLAPELEDVPVPSARPRGADRGFAMLARIVQRSPSSAMVTRLSPSPTVTSITWVT